ncbi:unnamed protein product [Plutella xylostella]|uniref:Glycoprotein-N-acetylgalactosamine 3-beta-galactosyltransferase 1 n=1 Tax=Plutella xylostella TaxID=51655 RepID=A0A8S4DMS0_PLUXY|nr:unnamed protein product [Plutella xylostella]
MKSPKNPRPSVPGSPAIPDSGSSHGFGGAEGTNNLRQRPAYQHAKGGTAISRRSLEPHKPAVVKTVAGAYSSFVKILCWVMTRPETHATRAAHVKATWGKRCDILLFMSTEKDNSLPTVKLNVQEGPEFLWRKTRTAFRYVHRHYIDRADWFLKADDDTYVIVENLRFMLFNYDTQRPIYFGHRCKDKSKQSYMSGGAGYVLSRDALDKLVNTGLPTHAPCSKRGQGNEDLQMGKCLESIGVRAMDSRDLYSRERFLPLALTNQFSLDFKKHPWEPTATYYKSKKGFDCCSDFAITFHGIDPQSMYLLDALVYHIRPYGIDYKHDPSSDSYEQ